MPSTAVRQLSPWGRTSADEMTVKQAVDYILAQPDGKIPRPARGRPSITGANQCSALNASREWVAPC
jgi:hypothetical protein